MLQNQIGTSINNYVKCLSIDPDDNILESYKFSEQISQFINRGKQYIGAKHNSHSINLNYTFGFGKYKGSNIRVVIQKDPQYIGWSILHVKDFFVSSEMLENFMKLNPLFSLSNSHMDALFNKMTLLEESIVDDDHYDYSYRDDRADRMQKEEDRKFYESEAIFYLSGGRASYNECNGISDEDYD